MNQNEYTLSTAREVGAPLITGTTESLRAIGWCSILLSLLWFGGLFAVLGFVVGLVGVLERNRVTVYPVPGLRLCYLGMALGIVGVAAAVALYV